MKQRARSVPGARWVVAILLPLLGCCSRAPPIDNSGPVAGWTFWGATEGGMRYSPLTQITPDNVTAPEGRLDLQDR